MVLKPSNIDNWPYIYTTEGDERALLASPKPLPNTGRYFLTGAVISNPTGTTRKVGILGHNTAEYLDLASTVNKKTTSQAGVVNVSAAHDCAFETWFRVSEKPTGGVLVDGHTASDPPDGFTVGITEDGFLGAGAGDGTNEVTKLVETDYADNEWHHMMVFFHRLGGKGTINVYVDGVLVGEATNVGTIVGVVGSSSTRLVIQGLAHASATTHVTAPGFYIRATTATGAFTAAEAVARYNNGTPLRHIGTEPGLTYYWDAYNDLLYVPAGAEATIADTAPNAKLTNSGPLEHITVPTLTTLNLQFDQAVPLKFLAVQGADAGLHMMLSGFDDIL